MRPPIAVPPNYPPPPPSFGGMYAPSLPRYQPPPLPRQPLLARAPIPVEPEPEYAPPMDEAPPAETLPPPPALVPGQPDNRFMEFCAANPSAPPCRGRVRG